MATNNSIPEKIRNFNMYMGPTASQRMVGVTNEVSLPEIAYSSEEVSGAGILGSFESPNVGHVESIVLEIPFRLLGAENLDLAVGDVANVTLRAGTQHTDIANQKVIEQGLVINVRGPVKQINMGKVGVGTPMDAMIAVEALYFKASRDIEGSMFTLLELDKLNFVYIVNGVDKLAGLRRYI